MGKTFESPCLSLRPHLIINEHSQKSYALQSSVRLKFYWHLILLYLLVSFGEKEVQVKVLITLK